MSVPDTVVATTTVRVVKPVPVAVTVYQPLPFGPPHPYGQSEHVELEHEDQEEQKDDWKDQMDEGTADAVPEQAVETQLESAEGVAH